MHSGICDFQQANNPDALQAHTGDSQVPVLNPSFSGRRVQNALHLSLPQITWLLLLLLLLSVVAFEMPD